MRTIRGAITLSDNTELDIRTHTHLVLKEILNQNDLVADDIESLVFTATKDITKAYPAKYARELGFHKATLMCLQEMFVEDSLPMCLRVLVFIKPGRLTTDAVHVYLKGAAKLRPDLSSNPMEAL